MRGAILYAPGDIRVGDRDDPRIEKPTDAIMQQVRDEARRRKIDLVVQPTAEAIGTLAKATAGTNAILHLTC